MKPVRAGVECGASAGEVFGFLSSGGGLPYAVEHVDPAMSTVLFRSAATLLSWGERVEVSVIATSGGCTVLFRGSGVHPINPTADPKGALGRIALALEGRFGPLRPLA